ncbi:MAG: 50S ribosomal protein L5 [Acidimicrobiia bacterium]
MPRLKEQYRNEIAPRLREQLGLANPMEVPTLTKIVVNVGAGEAAADAKVIDAVVEDLAVITGQHPRLNRARKSIANFKVRQGQAVGASVTLRGDRMWEFFDRLISLAIPRVRDFRGLSRKSFDGSGNYTFGLTEQLVFPEVDYDSITGVRGMDVTIVTSATSDEQAQALLESFGFPFRRVPETA